MAIAVTSDEPTPRPLPRRDGFVERDGRQDATTRSTATASPPSSCSPPGRSSTRASGRRRSRISRATSASSPSTAAATAARTARRALPPTRRTSSARTRVAVMDATGTDSAITVSLSAGTMWNLYLASQHPERVDGRGVHRARSSRVTGRVPGVDAGRVCASARSSYEGAERYNLHYIREDLAGFAQWWAELALPEPHSTMADRVRRRVGARDRRRDHRPHAGHRRDARRRHDGRGLRGHGAGASADGGGSPLPGARARGRVDAITPPELGAGARRDHRRPIPGVPGDRPRDRPQARALQPRAARLRAAPTFAQCRTRTCTINARQARPLHLLADRPRPCPARRRDREGAPRARAATWRSTGSPRTR